MIRINLLRDRRAERFAEALLGHEPRTVADLRSAAKAMLAVDMAKSMDDVIYAVLVSPETFNELKEIPGMETGIWQGVEIRESPMVPEGSVAFLKP